MKVRLLLVLPCIWLSCSAPRYTYDFGEPAATSKPGKAGAPAAVQRTPEKEHTFSVGLPVQPVTSIRAELPTPAPEPLQPQRESRKLRENPVAAAQALPVAFNKIDADLKRSVIFLAAGSVVLLIGGEVFVVLGSLSLLIGLIFGIKWLLRK